MAKRIVYLDGVDFQHEIGAAAGGNRVYPSVEDLKENNACWKGCGIVEAEVVFVRWVVPQDLHRATRQTTDACEDETQARIDHLQVTRDYLAQSLANIERQIKSLRGLSVSGQHV